MERALDELIRGDRDTAELLAWAAYSAVSRSNHGLLPAIQYFEVEADADANHIAERLIMLDLFADRFEGDMYVGALHISFSEAEELWAAIRRTRSRLVDALSVGLDDELTDVAGSLGEGGFTEGLDLLSEWMTQPPGNGHTMQTRQSLMQLLFIGGFGGEGGSGDLGDACMIAAETLRLALDRDISRAQSALGEELVMDRAGQTVPEPNNGTPGRYQLWVDSALALIETLADRDATRTWMWLYSWGRGDDSDRFVGQARDGLVTSLQAARRQQHGRYNLWALDQVYEAEESPYWPELLGAIDVELLLPSVMSLYRHAYERRASEVDNRSDQYDEVHRLVTTVRVQLQSF